MASRKYKQIRWEKEKPLRIRQDASYYIDGKLSRAEEEPMSKAEVEAQFRSFAEALANCNNDFQPQPMDIDQQESLDHVRSTEDCRPPCQEQPPCQEEPPVEEELLDHEAQIQDLDSIHVIEPTWQETENQAWEALQQIALDGMYLAEAPLHDSKVCTQCKGPEPAFKCKDCTHVGLFCQSCLISEHQTRPFHNILRWKDGTFEDSSLCKIGLVWNIGHDANCCDKARTPDGLPAMPQTITVVDTNGVHEVNVRWCKCRYYGAKHDHHEQLFENEIFPATPQRIRTAFTFRAMRLFHILHLQGKMNAWEWCVSIIRLTDNVLPGELKSFYNVFLRAYRQWVLLKCLRRSGFIDAQAPRPNGVFRVKCPACPQPNVNLPPQWDKHPHRDLLFAQFLGADGNFRLCRFKKGDKSQSEPSWIGDAGYFTPRVRTEKFLAARDKDQPEPSSVKCRPFKAMSDTGTGARKDTQGVMAVTDGRHAHYIQIADMPKGERQVFVDLCLSEPLDGIIDSGIKRVVFAYDIACQYSIHFSDRIKHPDFPLFTEEQLRALDKIVIEWLVGKFHLGAHVPECADKFSFNFTPNVGRSYGELPESNWSSLNGFATSTREMGWGHRRDTLSDVFGDWNWRKNVHLAEKTFKDHKLAKKMVMKKFTDLRLLESQIEPTRLKELQADRVKNDGRQYRATQIDAPTRAKSLQSIVQAEAAAEAHTRQEGTRRRGIRGSDSKSRGACLNLGITLERRLQNLVAKIKSDPKQSNECLKKIMVAVKDWQNIWRSVLPQTDDKYVDNTDNIPLEGFILDIDKNPILLRLPSEFCDPEGTCSELAELKKMEMELRVGEAFDALKSLRMFLGLKSFLNRQIHDPSAPKGLAPTLRSTAHSSRAQKQIDSFKATYRRNWARLKDLTRDCPAHDVPTNFKRLKKLEDAHCRTLAEWTEMDRQRKEAGERRRARNEQMGSESGRLPWIWRLEFDDYDPGLDDHPEIEKWNREVIRLEWLHAIASLERWLEEEALLVEESTRVAVTFKHDAGIWEKRAYEWKTEAHSAGKVAFAASQRRVYEKLAENAHYIHTKIRNNRPLGIDGLRIIPVPELHMR